MPSMLAHTLAGVTSLPADFIKVEDITDSGLLPPSIITSSTQNTTTLMEHSDLSPSSTGYVTLSSPYSPDQSSPGNTTIYLCILLLIYLILILNPWLIYTCYSLSIHLSIYISIYPYIYPSIHFSINLSFYPTIHILSIQPYNHLFSIFNLSINISIYLLSIHLSI